MVNTASEAGPGVAGPFDDRWLARSVLDGLPVVVWIKDPDGRYLGCNEAFAQFLGLAESEIVGMADTDIVDAELAAVFRARDIEALAADGPVTNEDSMVRPGDGRMILFETTKRALHSADGELVGILGIGFDITDRAATQARVEHERRALAEAERIAHIGSWEHDLRSGSVTWSDETFRIFGHDPASFLPTEDSFLTHIHPDDLAVVTGVMLRTRDTGEPFVFEHRIIVDGTVRHVEQHGRLELDADGVACRAVGTVQDVTDRVRDVQRVESFYHLVDRASDAIVLIDVVTGRVVEANRKALAALRAGRDTLVGCPVWDIVEQMSERWWRTTVAAADEAPQFPIRYDLRRFDGTTFPVEVSVELVDDEGTRYVLAVARDITDREEHERVLNEAAEQYRALIARSTDGFVLVDEHGHILDVNDVFCRQSGYLRDELLGMPMYELDADETPAGMRDRIERVVMAGGEVFEARHRRKDGSLWPVEVAISHTQVQGGRFFAFLRDVTTRNEADAALRVGAARWQKLLDGTPDGFARLDATGVILEVNDRYCELVGRSRSDLIGRSVSDVEAFTTEEELRDGLEELRRVGAQQIDALIERPDGTHVPVEISVVFSPTDGGQVFSFVRDTSERARLTDAVQTSAQWFDAVMASTSDGFLLVDLDGRVADASETYLRMSGYRSDELIGMSAEALDVLHDGDGVAERVQHVIRCGSSVFETMHRRKDGSVFPVEVSTSYTDLYGGRLLTFVRDITARRETQRAVREAAVRYSTLVAGTTDGFLLVDTNGIIHDVNDVYCARTGFDRSELVGRGLEELNVQDSAEVVKARFDRVMLGRPEVFESKHRRKDGTVWPVEVSLSYTSSEGGRFVKFVRDLSERLETEQAIHDGARRYEALVAGTKDAFCMTDLDGRILEVNETFCRWTGYSTEEALLLTVADLDAGRTFDELVAVSSQLAVAGAGFLDSLVRRKDGSTFPAEISVTASEIDGGRLFGFIRDVSERNDAQQRIEFLAYNDPLTGLPNRAQFASRLRDAIDRASERGTSLAVCYLDLDGFKPVNDRYGHEVGDVLLVQVGQRLRHGLSPGDEVARIGGDEFVVLLDDVSSLDDACEQARRLTDTILEPFNVEGHRLHLSASTGVTMFPEDEHDADTMLRHADQAMYEAKAQGSNGVRMYDPVSDREADRRRAAVHEFELALARDELTLFYQPRIELATGRVVGVEALVRWWHPSRGLLGPAAFLPLIEAMPLEFELDDWVLRRALGQLELWSAAGLDLSVSVNVTPRHIAQMSFPMQLAAVLDQFPHELRSRLELEVLETSAIGQVAEVAEVMARCTDLGVSFSLDDFGTGYSSLTYFHSLPVSVLKIDQDFVRNLIAHPRDLDIVEGVVQLANALHRPVVAEGVESIEIGMLLHRLGCQFAQGFGIAKPMPAESIPQWIDQFTSSSPWMTLANDAASLSDRYDLDLALYTHRRWTADLVDYLGSGSGARLPRTSVETCPVELWYRGVGAARYGDLPGYPDIGPLHRRVHELGLSLVLRSSGKVHPSTLELEEFRAASDELVQVLQRVADVVAADPGGA